MEVDIDVDDREVDRQMVDGKTILITGAGYLATLLTQEFLAYYKPKKIILVSRNEDKQQFAKAAIPDPRGVCRFMIGDVRDAARMYMVMNGVDIVIHTAAMKRVDDIEYNPVECVKTNVDGTWNVAWAAIERGVQKAIFISTDKAVQPINLYGATKLTGEKMWIHANFLKPIFSVVRYGNVMGSTGSVLPLFRKIAENKLEFPVTDEAMTRFWVEPKQAAALVDDALLGEPGHTYVAKSPTFRIADLCKALYGRAKLKIIGLRPGEKIHETIIHSAERVTDGKGYWLIHPDIRFKEEAQHGELLSRPITSKEDNITQGEIRRILK